MKAKIAINGFGRIGRTVMRIAKLKQHYDVVAINDLASPEQLAYAFRFDSIHGRYPGTVELDGDIMTIDGDPFRGAVRSGSLEAAVERTRGGLRRREQRRIPEN